MKEFARKKIADMLKTAAAVIFAITVMTTPAGAAPYCRGVGEEMRALIQERFIPTDVGMSQGLAYYIFQAIDGRWRLIEIEGRQACEIAHGVMWASYLHRNLSPYFLFRKYLRYSAPAAMSSKQVTI